MPNCYSKALSETLDQHTEVVQASPWEVEGPWRIRRSARVSVLVHEHDGVLDAVAMLPNGSLIPLPRMESDTDAWERAIMVADTYNTVYKRAGNAFRPVVQPPDDTSAPAQASVQWANLPTPPTRENVTVFSFGSAEDNPLPSKFTAPWGDLQGRQTKRCGGQRLCNPGMAVVGVLLPYPAVLRLCDIHTTHFHPHFPTCVGVAHTPAAYTHLVCIHTAHLRTGLEQVAGETRVRGAIF